MKNTNALIVCGCNRLENENFKGVYRCNNFVLGRGEKDDKNRM